MGALCNERGGSVNNVNVIFILILFGSSIVGMGFEQSVGAASQVPAMFAFGDSLIDVDNFLRSIAKSNYYPYGIDFRGGPTGRFTNGRTFVDMPGNLLGLPYAPDFADPNTRGNRILRGVNYASADGGNWNWAKSRFIYSRWRT